MTTLFMSSTSFPSAEYVLCVKLIQNSQNSDKRTKDMYLFKNSTLAGRITT